MIGTKSYFYASVVVVTIKCERNTIYTPKCSTRQEVIDWLDKNTAKDNASSEYWYVEDICVFENILGPHNGQAHQPISGFSEPS